MTLAGMEASGVRAGSRKSRGFDIHPARYKGRKFAVEPDATAGSYFFAAAAITGGTVTLEGLGTESPQGDVAYVDVLEHMGCTVVRDRHQTTLTRGPPPGVDVDTKPTSDT